MGLIGFALFCFSLAMTSSSSIIPEVDQPALRLPLRHVRGGSFPTADSSELLGFDNDRVKFLQSRLDNETTTPFVSDSIFTDGKAVKVPLSPGGLLGIGNYYTRIGLGTPASYHDVVLDTGSSFSWIQCEPCLVYCHPQSSSPFNPSSSSSYQKLTCGTNQCSSLKVATLNSPMCSASGTCIYSATYGDQSFSIGYLSKDSLRFGSESVPSFVFGCGQDNRGLFGKSAGLIGLGKNQLSFLSQLAGKYGKSFSYCLPTSKLVGKSGSGGYLTIGAGSNPARKYTPIITDSRDPTLYFLKLSAISVSGKPLTVAPAAYSSPIIIDSGTTISRLSTPLYSSFRNQIVKIVSGKYKKAGAISILDACFQATLEQISTVNLAVELIFQGGAGLKLAPNNVFLEVKEGTTCLAFASSSGVSIIGNTQQQTFDISFDVGSSRIGFAPGGCR